MHDAETRALRRAALLLILVSAVRWGWSRWNGPPAADGGTVLPELLSASREASREERQRARPLADDERIDPNRADAIELDRLPGVGPTTAGAIIAARDSGAVFRQPDDLLAVRGIGPATLARMRDALDLRSPPVSRRPSRPAAERHAPGGAGAGWRSPAATRDGDARAGGAPAAWPVDLNRAGVEELKELPGVGPALAARIVAARRERLFTSLDDLVRVPGIGPATLDKLRAYATIGQGR